MKKTEIAKEDDRIVVIYARKSKITHKGDSIANQEEYCKEYARLHLQLPPDYEFSIYEDEGKSGFYADRPGFQRMIRDVEQNRIRAIVCYKLDRISRRMADLTNLIEYLNKHDVALLISSNNLNTKDSNSKLMIQMLGMIAEFERDVIKERIQDNLIELAKDGRWMGGITPTGYTVERSKFGSGKKKNAFTFLVPIPEEKTLVQRIFSLFLSCRSMNATAQKLNEEGRHTKMGTEFTVLAVKDIIRNPVYCIADKDAYQYFIEHDGNVYGDESDFDGIHGVSVYNRTQQTKEASDDSSFLKPEFTKVTHAKDITEWIIAVGRHEGFIEGKNWVAAQALKEEIADRYNRPHRSTNALLSGLIYCPKCHKRLNVIPESNRFTHGKPRFKYACPNAIRKGPCDYQAVRGVEMDEYILERLSSMAEEEKEYYFAAIQDKIDQMIKTDKKQIEIKAVRKEIDKLEGAIKSQVKALRNATAATRPYLEADINDMTAEIAEKRKLLSRMEQTTADDQQHMKDFEQIKQTILSLSELLENAETQEIVGLINSVIERIYVTRNGNEQICHIFIKGCQTESYDDFFSHNDENEQGEMDYLKLCDSDRNRELHPLLCRHSASRRMSPADGSAQAAVRPGLRAADGCPDADGRL